MRSTAYLLSSFLVLTAGVSCGGSTETPGAGGAGGNSGTSAGGSGGTSGGGTGGTSGAAGSGGAGGGSGCSSCVSSTISWERSGGFVAFVDTYTLSPCRTLRVDRSERGAPPTERCTLEVPACGTDTATVADLVNTLALPDVVAAFEGGVLLGRDTRPVDGQILVVATDAGQLEIGDECSPNGPPNCVPIPTGVAQLRDVLFDIVADAEANPACMASP